MKSGFPLSKSEMICQDWLLVHQWSWLTGWQGGEYRTGSRRGRRRL